MTQWKIVQVLSADELEAHLNKLEEKGWTAHTVLVKAAPMGSSVFVIVAKR